VENSELIKEQSLAILTFVIIGLGLTASLVMLSCTE
jgi:hypothetical protein